jgi:hypothetical protein
VDAQQCVKLTGTNRSFGLIQSPSVRMQRGDPPSCRRASAKHRSTQSNQRTEIRGQSRFAQGAPGFLSSVLRPLPSVLRSDDLVVMARAQNTRSHPELGREIPQRQWYCVSRRGRVGRRQVFRTEDHHLQTHAFLSRDQRSENRRKGAFGAAATVLRSLSSVLRSRGVEQPGSSSGS